MNSKIMPLNNRLVLKPIDIEDKTSSGIILPGQDHSNDRVLPGEVIDVGSSICIPVEPGMKVLYYKHGGVEIKIDDVIYVVCRQEEILATLED